MSRDADVAVVVRECGERTADECVRALGEMFGRQIQRVSGTPFRKTLIKSLQAGLDAGRTWTLCVDADVLPTPGLMALVDEANDLPSSVFEVQGLVFDKLIPIYRPAGNHLYRTALVSKALGLIRPVPVLRPESEMINAMARQGHEFHQSLRMVGLHDFEQHPVDVFSKALLHRVKHDYLMEDVLPIWRSQAACDDYRVAASAASLHVEPGGAELASREFMRSEANTVVQRLGLEGPGQLEAISLSELGVMLRKAQVVALGADAGAVGRLQRSVDIAMCGEEPLSDGWRRRAQSWLAHWRARK